MHIIIFLLVCILLVLWLGRDGFSRLVRTTLSDGAKLIFAFIVAVSIMAGFAWVVGGFDDAKAVKQSGPCSNLPRVERIDCEWDHRVKP